MAVVPGYLNDVFISYVRDDNAATGGLIAAFQKELEVQLKAAGLKKYQPEIFFDISDGLKGADVERQFASHARLSAVLVAFWSPLYVDSRYCRGEWEAFTQSAQDLKGRLFIGEMMFGVRERALRELGCPHHPLTVPLYYESAGKYYTMAPDEKNLDGHSLRRIATDIAREAAVQLEAMRAQMLSASPRVPRAVLTAPQSMEDFVHKTAVACCQSGIITLDNNGLAALRQRPRPDGGDTVAEWLAEADVIADFIDPQMPLAPAVMVIPPGKERLRWLRRDAAATEVSAAVAELRKDAAVRECSHSDFLEELKRVAYSVSRRTTGVHTPPPPASPPGAAPAPAADAPEHKPLVLILTYKGDEPKVMPLQDYFEQHGVISDIPPEEEILQGVAPAGAALQASSALIKELLAFDPSAIVFVDGSGPAAWIDNRLRSWRLLRSIDLPELRCAEIDPLPKTDRRVRLSSDQYLDINKPDELKAFLQSLTA